MFFTCTSRRNHWLQSPVRWPETVLQVSQADGPGLQLEGSDESFRVSVVQWWWESRVIYEVPNDLESNFTFNELSGLPTVFSEPNRLGCWAFKLTIELRALSTRSRLYRVVRRSASHHGSHGRGAACSTVCGERESESRASTWTCSSTQPGKTHWHWHLEVKSSMSHGGTGPGPRGRASYSAASGSDGHGCTSAVKQDYRRGSESHCGTRAACSSGTELPTRSAAGKSKLQIAPLCGTPWVETFRLLLSNQVPTAQSFKEVPAVLSRRSAQAGCTVQCNGVILLRCCYQLVGSGPCCCTVCTVQYGVLA